MKIRLVKKCCLMMVCILATAGITSCSSDDEPKNPTIQNLDQKLLTGIWISGAMEKGNLFTLEFKEGNIVTINVIHDNKEYYRQLESSYKVSGNDILIRGSKTDAKTITVKSIAENEMVVEAINLTTSGETVTNTFVRRNPTTADKLENTTWTVKTKIPWVNANKDELTLPGNLTINGKRTINPNNYQEIYNKIIDDDFRMIFNEKINGNQTLAQVTAYDGQVSIWTYPYSLDGYKLDCYEMIGGYQTNVDYTLFKTEEGDLFCIFEKNAVVAYTLDYFTLEAEMQGCEITDDEWSVFANELEACLERATLLMILQPDPSGRNYYKEALVGGKWVWEEDGNKDVMTFMDNGKMQNTFINDDINGEAQLKYSVTGNTLTLVNNNDVEIPYAIYLFGDMLVMTGADFTRIYYRQASE